MAQCPTERREQARLLWLEGAAAPRDEQIARLPELIRGDELLVMNDTRVVRARLRGRKSTGGRVELLVLAPEAIEGATTTVHAMGRANKPLRPGTTVQLDRGGQAVVEDVLGEGHLSVRLATGGIPLWDYLERHGELPLPPYIERPDGPTEADRARYQTVFAAHEGSVAAPTAGLHLTEELLAALRSRGCETAFVTLHVGPGTFRPVRAETLDGHRMHSERYSVSAETARTVRAARAAGRPIVAVGTTTVRTLEAAAAAGGGELIATEGDTDLFIRPGFEFKVVDQLLTNFHLPRSTLLMLVAALTGRERLLDAYALAVDRGYRFYSYGDAMWIR